MRKCTELKASRGYRMFNTWNGAVPFTQGEQQDFRLATDVEGLDTDSLRAGRSGGWVPVGATFSHPTRLALEPTPSPVQLVPDLLVSFPGVKRPGPGVDQPPQSSAEVKDRVELYFCSPSWPSWPVLGWTFYKFGECATRYATINKNAFLYYGELPD